MYKLNHHKILLKIWVPGNVSGHLLSQLKLAVTEAHCVVEACLNLATAKEPAIHCIDSYRWTDENSQGVWQSEPCPAAA